MYCIQRFMAGYDIILKSLFLHRNRFEEDQGLGIKGERLRDSK